LHGKRHLPERKLITIRNTVVVLVTQKPNIYISWLLRIWRAYAFIFVDKVSDRLIVDSTTVYTHYVIEVTKFILEIIRT
jgi:hypothetical protein